MDQHVSPSSGETFDVLFDRQVAGPAQILGPRFPAVVQQETSNV